MAYAAAEFGHSCLRALAGEANVIECAYVESHLTELSFFASPVRLGPEGVQVSSMIKQITDFLFEVHQLLIGSAACQECDCTCSRNRIYWCLSMEAICFGEERL